uniref:NurA domain-containing protein n=1 Tax=uncultured marine thaumarchaeote KM3_74_C10 TaxID=1456270 RepID=A0A075HML7_9ARCH|nr:hypothetical protein [uncultured marine thaumarchaeote KM3_74_C10]
MMLNNMNNDLNFLSSIQSVRGLPRAPLEKAAELLATTMACGIDRGRGKKVTLSDDSGIRFPIPSSLRLGFDEDIEPINGAWKTKLVVGLDSSCIRLAQADDGAFYSVKIAAIGACGSELSGYLVIGPLLMYIDETNAKTLIKETVAPGLPAAILVNNNNLLERLIRVISERVVTHALVSSLEESLILIDGCLRPSLMEPIVASISAISRTARERGNEIIGISKGTQIRILANYIDRLCSSSTAPSFVEIPKQKASLSQRITERIFAVRFSRAPIAFRVDIPFNAGRSERRILSEIVHNDDLSSGYPQTLRLAHHNSLFARSEIMSLRTCMRRDFGVKPQPSQPIRPTALGCLASIGHAGASA